MGENIKDLLDNIPLSSRDFSSNAMDAFLYGITVGWNGTDDFEDSPEISEGIKEEFIEKFGWNDDDWETILKIKDFIDSMKI
jgi:hypothetical protein